MCVYMSLFWWPSLQCAIVTPAHCHISISVFCVNSKYDVGSIILPWRERFLSTVWYGKWGVNTALKMSDDRLDFWLVRARWKGCISGDRRDRWKPVPARDEPGGKSILDVTWVISADSIAEVIIYFTCINPGCVTDTVEPSTFIGTEIRWRRSLGGAAASERRVRCLVIIYSVLKLRLQPVFFMIDVSIVI